MSHAAYAADMVAPAPSFNVFGDGQVTWSAPSYSGSHWVDVSSWQDASERRTLRAFAEEVARQATARLNNVFRTTAVLQGVDVWEHVLKSGLYYGRTMPRGRKAVAKAVAYALQEVHKAVL